MIGHTCEINPGCFKGFRRRFARSGDTVILVQYRLNKSMQGNILYSKTKDHYIGFKLQKKGIKLPRIIFLGGRPSIARRKGIYVNKGFG